MSNQGDIGSRGERTAAEFLRRARGFAVVACNWRNPGDRREEIDLVCRDREVLVFVEVKTRVAGARVPGYFAVDRQKRRVLLRVFQAYLRRLRHRPATFRFDVVEVEVTGGEPVVRHFQNVELFSKHFHA